MEGGDGAVVFVLESSGGRRTDGTTRNADYRKALLVTLQRLAAVGAVIEDALIVSRATAGLPAEERRLKLDRWSYPVLLNKVDDLEGTSQRADTGSG